MISIKKYNILLFIISFIYCSADNDIDSLYEGYKEFLDPKLKQFLNDNCTYRGYRDFFLYNEEPANIKCPLLNDILLRQKYHNYTILWKKLGERSSRLLNTHGSIFLDFFPYKSELRGSVYECMIILNNTCDQFILKLNDIRSNPVCYHNDYKVHTNIEIFCNVINLQYDYITWYKNNSEIIIDGYKYSNQSRRLLVYNTTYNDSGIYYCNAYTTHGKNTYISRRCSSVSIHSHSYYDFYIEPINNITYIDPDSENTQIYCKAISYSNSSYILIYWEDEYGGYIYDNGIYQYDNITLIGNEKVYMSILVLEKSAYHRYVNNTFTCLATSVYVEKKTTTTLVIKKT
ncbi:SPV132 IFN-alpha/beta-like binding protein [Swinepox virus]|nr:SPV132 IFN-alpha/beta-like binding protein [Swinepox virus]UED36731.1 SPV132 IFN-alpha/beta-like binding protein [Swinepox virus]